MAVLCVCKLGNGFSWDDQEMGRGLRVDVFERHTLDESCRHALTPEAFHLLLRSHTQKGIYLLIFIDEGGRDLFAKNLPEDSVSLGHLAQNSRTT